MLRKYQAQLPDAPGIGYGLEMTSYLVHNRSGCSRGIANTHFFSQGAGRQLFTLLLLSVDSAFGSLTRLLTNPSHPRAHWTKQGTRPVRQGRKYSRCTVDSWWRGRHPARKRHHVPVG